MIWFRKGLAIRPFDTFFVVVKNVLDIGVREASVNKSSNFKSKNSYQIGVNHADYGL